MSTTAESSTNAAVAVILVAAGSGRRLGLGLPKAFVPLANGTVLEAAISGVRRAGVLAQLIVVAPYDHLQEAARIARRVYRDDTDRLVTVIPGGDERADSVAAGLRALAPDVVAVLVHDAARALTPPELFDAVAGLVLKLGCGVVPVLPVVDTVKRVLRDGEIAGTLDRRDLALAQTPQGFPRGRLEAAYRLMGPAATTYTDDAAIYSAAGHRVVTTTGRDRAFKITHPQDLRRAETILSDPSIPESERPALARGPRLPRTEHLEDTDTGTDTGTGTGTSRTYRTGVGADAHAFGETPPLRLGGVEWPDFPALEGHSDGDAACHAIVDALLAASGLGDIGTVFGVGDPAMAGYAGTAFIRDAVNLLVAHGWTIHSVSVEIVTNAPRIGERRAELERVLGEAVGAPVSVAGTTADGLGLTGEGRGIGAVASALLSR
ncbi:MAG TPA: 2-C-methyl-D-erythritol 4-phosphate cytidylyltransferase [Microbacteriaceae bacterium]|nr:2-C-methyl-D-erythritol 4-phosphate cytidylyltransferase [Microbacteriaceae bacterium]